MDGLMLEQLYDKIDNIG